MVITQKERVIHMKKIFLLFLALGLLTGCRHSEPLPQTLIPTPTAPQTAPLPAPAENSPQTTPTFPADSYAIYDGSATSGNVTALTGWGCTISVGLLEDLDGGTSVMTGAAPGHEDSFPSVDIRYIPGCAFIRANASLSSGALDCQVVTAGDITEQTYIIVHGETDSNGVINANTVYLYRVVP